MWFLVSRNFGDPLEEEKIIPVDSCFKSSPLKKIKYKDLYSSLIRND